MAKDTIKSSKEQMRRVAELGALPEGELAAPKGISPFDIGAPPDAKETAAALEGAADGDKRTHEHWATEEGYLPAAWKNPAAYRKGRLRAVAPTANPKHWIYAGALAHHQWPIGLEMTRAEFRAAVAKAHDFTIG